MFTVYCGYLSARNRAISTTVVTKLLQMYLPDAASACQEHLGAAEVVQVHDGHPSKRLLDAFQHRQRRLVA